MWENLSTHKPVPGARCRRDTKMIVTQALPTGESSLGGTLRGAGDML